MAQASSASSTTMAADAAMKETMHEAASSRSHSFDDPRYQTEANILPEVENQDYEKDIEKVASEKLAPPPSATDPSSFPDGGLEAWLVVFGGFCCLFVSFGWINCIGVFQEYYQTNLLSQYSPSAISWIVSLETFMMFLGGPVFGKIYDNYGPRYLLLGGSFLHVFGLMMTSISTEYYQFILAQGICSPIGASAIFYPAMSSVSTWFFHRRALAFGVMASGSSLGGVIFPILVQRLIPNIGFPWTMRVAAFIILGMLVIGNLTVKSRLPPNPKPFVLKAFVRPLREPAFALVTVASFFVFFGIFIPFNFITLQGQAVGMSVNLSSYLLAIVNAFSIFGRTLPGYLGDRFGRFNVMVIMNFFSAIIILALWLPSRSNAPVIVFAALYGFGSGAFVSMLPACVAQISDIREIGIRTGTIFAIVSVAALCGNPIGGALLGDGTNFTKLQIFAGVTYMAGAAGFLLCRTRLVKWEIWKKI
ncbi:hypothetical protein MMC19_006506 [Ptychographa xylographoides]|nr:hypothetical protein [Ptychographa xylographoides]